MEVLPPCGRFREQVLPGQACGVLMEPALEKHPGVAQRDRIQNWPDFQKPNTNGRFSSNLMETNYPHLETISASLILKEIAKQTYNQLSSGSPHQQIRTINTGDLQGEKGTLLRCSWKWKLRPATMENLMQVPLKQNQHLPGDPASPQ